MTTLPKINMTPEQKQLEKTKKEIAKWSLNKRAETAMKLRLIKFNDWTLNNEIMARALNVPAPTNKFGGAHFWPTLDTDKIQLQKLKPA
jgi:hypothetical protein